MKHLLKHNFQKTTVGFDVKRNLEHHIIIKIVNTLDDDSVVILSVETLGE
jgi:hypothetical protein